MAGANANVKDIGNALYKGALLATATVGSRYVTKSLGFKERPVEPKLKSVGMLALDISAATYIVQQLQDAKVIPDKIFV